jgi:hypothetical protein
MVSSDECEEHDRMANTLVEVFRGRMLRHRVLLCGQDRALNGDVPNFFNDGSWLVVRVLSSSP